LGKVANSPYLGIPNATDANDGMPRQDLEKEVLSETNPKDFVANNGEDGFVKMYGNMLETHVEAYKAVLAKIGERKGGVLFHCTGWLISFLVSLI
jgi:hypothetical protein